MAKKKSIFAEFKAFISKGNVLDMAIGVVIGGAFSAIVTALVSILMSLATYAIPGGIAGLVTVLPAVPGNAAQAGIAGIGQVFYSDGMTDAVNAYARSLGQADASANFTGYQTALLGLYTKHGGKYIANGAAIIDWGALINAVISFFIVAVTLFVILKVATLVRTKREQMAEAAREAYYVKHPEERPVPPEPGKPEPTTNEILTEIKNILEKK